MKQSAVARRVEGRVRPGGKWEPAELFAAGFVLRRGNRAGACVRDESSAGRRAGDEESLEAVDQFEVLVGVRPLDRAKDRGVDAGFEGRVGGARGGVGLRLNGDGCGE